MSDYLIALFNRLLMKHFSEQTNVTVSMNLEFDTDNTGSVGLLKSSPGTVEL